MIYTLRVSARDRRPSRSTCVYCNLDFCLATLFEMSKGAGGPAASSFNSPRKTGWLYKHGGSGISSHWKKRWFIADDHYLFYYKTPTDKKPVGILCLQEYGSCQKADVREWKKSFSFIIGKSEGLPENTESGGGGTTGGKDYVLYSDSEGDMNAWIQALQEEMKSSGLYVSGGPVNYGGSSKVKVDQKAIEEVTKAASDGPKLTHLTAQRPRVKGRRPPKRYATYHEEDKDESPPATPTFDRNTPASPQPSPSASPTSKTKGHRPAVPLMPKQRSITSSPPPTSNESPKVTKILPTPPAKVAKEKEEVEADVVPVPKQRPVPPKRPLKPRSATDAPRPVPAPRRVVGKEGAIFPAKDLPPDEDKDVDVEQAEESPVTETPSTQETAQEISTNESPLTAPEDTTKQEEKVNEMVENRLHIKVLVMEEKLHTKTTETPPTPQPQEENKTSTDISTGYKKDNRAVSEHDQEKRHVSSADEYEHMKPGITKDKSQGPEYEHLDVLCSPSPSTQSPQKQDSKYATPSAATKQKETTYAVPHVTGDTNASVLPATPQISLVASENEENLTTGSGKSSIPQQSEDHLKPVKFEIERDALGYSKVMKKKSDDKKVPPGSPVQSDDEPPPPPLWTGMDAGLDSNDVPSTLHQAREILRLAQVMKKEIEDMRREVQRELELARRERQDAELIKKNATEILRMAKEKLNQKPPP